MTILDVFTVLSNLFLLIPFVTAVRYHRILRAIVLFLEVFASGLYHLCDSFNVCLFSFSDHHHLDFFFAQTLIILAAFYFIEFSFGNAWIEWVLILLGMFGIAILQITLPGELFVQGAIAGVAFVILVIYWLYNGIPEYDWPNVTTGVTLLACSIVLFSVQELYSSLYWAIHSLWHITAAIGLDFIFRIKALAYRFQATAQRIKFA